jgi:hypothetical protein
MTTQQWINNFIKTVLSIAATIVFPICSNAADYEITCKGSAPVIRVDDIDDGWFGKGAWEFKDDEFSNNPISVFFSDKSDKAIIKSYSGALKFFDENNGIKFHQTKDLISVMQKYPAGYDIYNFYPAHNKMVLLAAKHFGLVEEFPSAKMAVFNCTIYPKYKVLNEA